MFEDMITRNASHLTTLGQKPSSASRGKCHSLEPTKNKVHVESLNNMNATEKFSIKSDSLPIKLDVKICIH